MSYYYSGNSQGGFFSSLPTVTRNLLIINILIFVAYIVNKSFMIETFALFYPSSPFFRWWQPITHMFMHGGFWHIFFNMYTLAIFGGVVERYLGPKKFTFFYFICGLGAAGLHIGVEALQMQSLMESAALGHTGAMTQINIMRGTPTVGASGAIYGLLIAYAMLFPQSRMTLLFPPVTLSAKWMVIIFVVIELVTGMTGSNQGVAHFAHLGGALIGYLLMLQWRKRGNLFDKNSI